MLKLLFSITILVGIAVQENMASGTCRKANWWHSFDKPGWSNCPANTPYINGLLRSKSSHPHRDWIYHLEGASCCDAGRPNAECVQANWVHSFDKHRTWNLCPAGYYLSGLHRSHGHNLHNIEHARCCKPRGAPNSYKSCYDEGVWSSFDWNRKGMVSCKKPGHFITGLYRSTCNHLYCIDMFKCCELSDGRWRNIGKGCAGARDNKFASLTYKGPPGFVSAFRLTHTHGKVGCVGSAKTNWGCNGHYRTDMYVTDVRNAVMYPSRVLTKPHHHGGWYHLPGYFENSPQLVFSDVGTRFIYRGQQMRVWYGEDLYGYTEHDNHGSTCFTAELYFVK
ncbi:uncharacterized protein LOC114515610 [Dendronephthya gigantea]|uniref:uncharacterized protein LOC114515610 n=1 Tax=Dendronephthya gigantea TaxID=151771 RepID=UPI0010698B10|nr:uncharacterized protein LOC114515610 [Dendronephthya gigantea]